MEEHYFHCPYCWEEISMMLDLSIEGQTYVEDCEVCCRPISIRYRVINGEVDEFEALTLDD